jgi:hypothetical protein
VVNAQHTGGEKNQYDSAYPHASAATETPAAMTVVRPTSTQSQQPNDHEYQHCDPPSAAFIRQGGELVSSKSHKYLVNFEQTVALGLLIVITAVARRADS